jgi:hydrogenase expression/formation protein HypD
MRFIDEFRDPALVRGLAERIARISTRPARLMEFCGGHTVAILRNGLRQLLPRQITLVSGPGCPVCVTAQRDLDLAIRYAQLPGVIVATFGDMVKVPGSGSSLAGVRARGADVRVVYSPLDAVDYAAAEPARKVIFIAAGFETTAPGVAAAVLEAEKRSLANFHVYSLLKTSPHVVGALLGPGGVKLDGLICPGHVSSVIGWKAWAFIPRDYGLACAVAGFEPLDILLAVDRIVEQIERGQPSLDDAYPRGVKAEGNPHALELMDKVFIPAEAHWRGLGTVRGSGLMLRPEHSRYDALAMFPLPPGPVYEPSGCRCGEVLRGLIDPPECGLFGKQCTPEWPVGPCMVSTEGACAAWRQYAGVA